MNRILTSDALATTAGSLAGASTVVNYIESAAGVTAIVAGLMFRGALFVAPALVYLSTALLIARFAYLGGG